MKKKNQIQFAGKIAKKPRAMYLSVWLALTVYVIICEIVYMGSWDWTIS